MRQDGTNVYSLTIIMDSRNESCSITTDIEDRQFAHLISAWEKRTQFRK